MSQRSGRGGGTRGSVGQAWALTGLLCATALLLAAVWASERAMPAVEETHPTEWLDPAEEPEPADQDAALERLAALERARISAHLARVESDLRAREVGHLTAEQRENRARHLDVLREYRERGLYPRNLDFPGRRVPYFVDDRGVHCAVGYLIHRDGRDDLVERIAAERNHARIRELADDPELVAWLETSGLTAAEAARIQPAYCFIREDCNTEPVGGVEGGLVRGYAALSLNAALGLATAAVGVSSLLESA